MKPLNLEFLEELLENEDLSLKTKSIIQILLSATNDWPNPTDSLQTYEIEVQNFISSIDINKNTILAKLSDINYNKNAWESESLHQLLEIFEYFETKTSLKEIIEFLYLELS